MDSLTSLIIGDSVDILPELIVSVRMVIIMFSLEMFALVVRFLGGRK